MSNFRELTSEEENRRSLIIQSTTSAEAMRQLEDQEIDLSLALAKVAVIMTEQPSPFASQASFSIGDLLAPNPTSDAGATVKSALGHAMIGQMRHQYEVPEDITTAMLSDIYSQAEAGKLAKGIDDKAYGDTLSEANQRIIGYARDDEDVKADIVNHSKGRYHELDDYYQGELSSEMNGSKLPQSVKEGVSRFYGSEDYRFDHAKFTEEDISHGNSAGLDRINSLLISGSSTGTPAVDQVVKAVADRVGKDHAPDHPEAESTQYQRIVHAGARLLVLHERGNYIDPKAGAALMLNDIGIQRSASFAIEHQTQGFGNSKNTNIIASGQWHQLDHAGSSEVANAMNAHRSAAALDVVAVQSMIIKNDAEQAARREQHLQAARMHQAGMGM